MVSRHRCYDKCVSSRLLLILSVVLSVVLPLFGQEDPVVRFSKQVPKVEFLYVISDGNGDVFALGRSNDPSLPVSRNAAQRQWGGGVCSGSPCYDAVVAKFRGSDGEIVAATFLGGFGD